MNLQSYEPRLQVLLFLTLSDGLSYDINRPQPTFHSVCILSGGSESFQVFGGRGQLPDPRQRFIAVGGCIGAERHDGFPAEVVALRERIDNHRGRPPPNGTTDEYGVVLVPVIHFGFDGRPGIGFLFGFRHLGAGAVFGGIRFFGVDAKQRAAGERSDAFGNVLRIAALTEIGDKRFCRSSVRGDGLSICPCTKQQGGKQSYKFCFHT